MKLTQEEIKNQNCPVTIKEVESVVKNILINKKLSHR